MADLPIPKPETSGPGRAAALYPILALVFVAGLAWWAWPDPEVTRGRPEALEANHWAAVDRARRLLAHGQPERALRELDDIRDDRPGAAEAMTLAGRAFIILDQTQLARMALERALSLDREQPEALKMLAAIYLLGGDSPRGLFLLKEAARLDPQDFRPWQAMGKVYLDMGDPLKSAESYAQALARKPGDPDLFEGQARGLLHADRQDQASAVLDEALALHPDRPQLLGLAARLARDQGRLEVAAALADRALRADPDVIDALMARASARHLRGDSAAALADIDHILTINPNDLAALNLKSQVEARLGLTEQARQTVQRTRAVSQRIDEMDRLSREISAHPDDPGPKYELGQVALEANMLILAMNCFRAALDVDPDYQPAREAMETLHREHPELIRESLVGPAPPPAR